MVQRMRTFEGELAPEDFEWRNTDPGIRGTDTEEQPPAAANYVGVAP